VSDASTDERLGDASFEREHLRDLDARLGRVVVTGGGGFLGERIVALLRDLGVNKVTAVGRRKYERVLELGANSVVADVADGAALSRALAGADTVIHTAALAGVFGPAADFHRANVLGTRNVLAACAEHAIARLVLTSSPSVVFDGTDHVDAANDLPYPARYLAAYPRTKAEAERMVLAANGPRLATVALRPHLIFGPRDPHLVPRLIERARAGRLRRVGTGANRVSLTFVDNAAWAHLDAAAQLCPGAAHSGRAYFVNQSEPVAVWDWIDRVLAGVGAPVSGRAVPARVAYAAGAVCEGLWRVLPVRGEPPMTRFVAQQLALEHTYSLEPAQRDFGYRERVDLAEATARTIAAFAR
jgi:2-alkyl-3-oxoalkanoate reductase